MSSSDNNLWEAGSEYHWGCLRGVAQQSPDVHPWAGKPQVLGASGRDVLRLIVEHGMRIRGWKRFWVPSYLCQEVVSSIVETGIQCVLYADVPQVGSAASISDIDFASGDALFVVNQFGIRARPDMDKLNVDVVEDHTHDPWSEWARSSTASFCLASLRKTLPIPDGGVLWAPCGQDLPGQPPCTESRELAALRKFAGMALKQKYLARELSSKDAFRELYLAGENHIADGAISGASSLSVQLISHLDVLPWRETRMGNLRLLSELLSDVEELTLWDLEKLPGGQVPLSFLVQARSKDIRERLRSTLIKKSIYPAILWPLQAPIVVGVSEEDLHLSDTCLSIHVDARYDADDIHRISEAVREAFVTSSK